MKQKETKTYRIQKGDIRLSGEVLENAFQDDPFWKEMLKDFSQEQKQLFFRSSVQFCRKYGKALATSKNLEGIAAWVDSKNSTITVLKSILSGTFFSMMQMGLKTFGKIINLIKIMEKLDENKKKWMKNKDYIYFIIIGVRKEFQGKGYGKILLNEILQESIDKQKNIYLETTTEKNMKFYNKYGFHVRGVAEFDIKGLSQWGMEREYQTKI